jgi:hypothetical protein
LRPNSKKRTARCWTRKKNSTKSDSKRRPNYSKAPMRKKARRNCLGRKMSLAVPRNSKGYCLSLKRRPSCSRTRKNSRKPRSWSFPMKTRTMTMKSSMTRSKRR